jgi:hypothetical protein
VPDAKCDFLFFFKKRRGRGLRNGLEKGLKIGLERGLEK